VKRLPRWLIEIWFPPDEVRRRERRIRAGFSAEEIMYLEAGDFSKPPPKRLS
jgi:hypothetical protein